MATDGDKKQKSDRNGEHGRQGSINYSNEEVKGGVIRKNDPVVDTIPPPKPSSTKKNE